jgi:hypothetical protein
MEGLSASSVPNAPGAPFGQSRIGSGETASAAMQKDVVQMMATAATSEGMSLGIEGVTSQ